MDLLLSSVVVYAAYLDSVVVHHSLRSFIGDRLAAPLYVLFVGMQFKCVLIFTFNHGKNTMCYIS